MSGYTFQLCFLKHQATVSTVSQSFRPTRLGSRDLHGAQHIGLRAVKRYCLGAETFEGVSPFPDPQNF